MSGGGGQIHRTMDAQEIYDRIFDAQREIKKLEGALKELQDKCHHAYVRSRDDDYHASKFMYLCKKCDHLTYMRPETFEVER